MRVLVAIILIAGFLIVGVNYLLSKWALKRRGDGPPVIYGTHKGNVNDKRDGSGTR